MSSVLFFQLLLLDSSAVRYRRLVEGKNSLYIIDLIFLYFPCSGTTTSPAIDDGQVQDVVRSIVLFAVHRATII